LAKHVVADLPPGVTPVADASVSGAVAESALGSLGPAFKNAGWQGGWRVGRGGAPDWLLVLEVDQFPDAAHAQQAEAAVDDLPVVRSLPANAGAKRTTIKGAPPIGADGPDSHYFGVLDTTTAGDRRATIRYATGRYTVWIQLVAKPDDPTVWAATLATRQAKALGGG
jgi:hypothetical protein